MNNQIQIACLAMTLLLLHSGLRAQEPAAARMSVLPSFDSQVGAHLAALDRELAKAVGHEHVGALVGHVNASPIVAGTMLNANPRLRESLDYLAEKYIRLMQESGDALVTLPGRPSHVGSSSSQVRRLCQQRLLQMPRATLEGYRRLVDGEASALFEQGRQLRSAAPLRRLVREMSCSSPAERAVEMLGDLAFEQGDFSEAIAWWSMRTPVDTNADVSGASAARTRAKQILAMVFDGRLNDAQMELVRFRHQFPRTIGSLAGQNSGFATILERFLAEFAKDRRTNNNAAWTTFGGDVTRSRCLSQAVSWRLWEDGPAWRVPLPTAVGPNGTPTQPLGRRLAYHPVIAYGQVLIADHRSVSSFDAISGKELFRFEPELVGLADLPAEVDSKADLPRFTLTVDGDRAFVLLGQLGMAPKREAASYLMCLDISQPTTNRKRLLWHIRAKSDDRALAYFEGAPLVKDGRVYAALSKIIGQSVATSIVCYDRTGRLLWTRDVCECPEFENGAKARFRQHLLTWGAGQIVYCSHAGAVVAVDAWTGEATWGVRYPSRGPTLDHEPSPRDLAPAVYADGRFFAAPLDSDRVFCVDAASGNVLWELEEIEVVHLLGIVQGQLMAATRNGITSIRTTTGDIRWMQPSGGRLASAGRGLIAGGWLFWPTQDGLLPYRALSLRTGSQQKTQADSSVMPEPLLFDPSMLHALPIGNWAFGEGVLVIAGTKELVAYTPLAANRQLPIPAARPQARLTAPGKHSGIVNNP